MADIEEIPLNQGEGDVALPKPTEGTAPTEPTETGTEMPPDYEGEEEDEGEGPAPPRAQMDFLFLDEKKKKKKGKKAKPPPVKRPTKGEYVQTITELNATLAALNKKVGVMDDYNYKRSEELVETKEQHQEVSEHLKRVLNKHRTNLTIEEEYNVEIIKKREELEISSTTRIKSLQTQYKNTLSQLNGEIEMLTTKLSTLRVFSDARDEMLKKLSDMEIEYKQSDQAFMDRLYSMQQKAVVERNKLDKEAKTRFERIVDDFTEWREVRNAAYTRRLLSENSDLRRKYNKLVPLNLRKERELTGLLEKTANIKDTHAAIYDITKQLENTQAKRNILLEKLQKFHSLYSLQVVLGSKYRRLYEAVQKHEMKENEKYKTEDVLYEDIQAHNEALFEKIQALKQAEHEYLFVRQQYDLFVNSVKKATYSLCSLAEYERFFPYHFNEYMVKRDGIIRGLVDLITSCKRLLRSKAMIKAQYYKGYLGFMPFDELICQMFKCKGCTAKTSGENLENVPSYCIRNNWLPFDKDAKKLETDEYSDPGLMCLK